MASFSTYREANGVITIIPDNENDQSGLVVFCHGLGDTAEGVIEVAESIASQIPYLKFILPTAPTQPVTGKKKRRTMPSWYDIRGNNESFQGIQQSKESIIQILQHEHNTTRLPYSRMVLAGFSQGGALSLFTGLQLPSKIGGVVMMSGYLPAPDQFTVTDGLQDTPILHCHGEEDTNVVVDRAKKCQEVVTTQMGATDYELKTYPGLKHKASMEEINDISTFLKKVLPPTEDATCRITLKSRWST